MSSAIERDPAARSRATLLLVAVVVMWPMLTVSGFQPLLLFEAQNLTVIGKFLRTFLPPATDREFLLILGKATLETLAIATAGMAVAMLISVPLAMASTRALSISAIGPGRGVGRSQWLRSGVRLIMTILRGIPDLVWALLFVRVFGLGPAAGVLALGLTYGGMLAKVYSEILESGDTRPAKALLESGASRSAALLHGLIPGSAQELLSYTVYRWECAVRASVVMGFVGAGGLGQLMDQAMKMLNGGESASILLVFLGLVLAADGLSGQLRRRLGDAGLRGARQWGMSPGAATLLVLLAVSVVASVLYLDIGLAALFTLESAGLMGDFVLRFFPPDLSAEWLARVGKGALETLAISVVGTLLAAVGGLLLALPASGRYAGMLQAPARFVLNSLRSVPELVWATITVLAAGLGAFAGTLALALHTAGVLGRLFAEALENAPEPPSQALRDAGSGSIASHLYGTLPEVAPQLLAYTLYRWEMNIRMAAVLGFVGAGGLGQLLHVSLSLFHHAQASTVIAAMLLLSVLVDEASGRLRRWMGST